MRITKKNSAATTSVSAPIGGLNARDSLASMPPQDAVTMDNFFPSPTSVDLRRGYKNYVTGIGSNVESLMTYSSATTGKVFAAAGSAIYDVTNAGTVGAASVSGLSNARWQYQNFGTVGGQYIYCANGADPLQLYNGTSWQSVTDVSTPIAITGVTTSKLVHINEYRSRLFFVEKDSFRVWFMPVASVGGAASSIDFSPIFKLGGYLMAMATWTVEESAGMNEYAVFISSQGECAVYLGTDPSVASNFTIVSKFRIGRPIGRRCFTRVGSDIVLITEDGFFPLSKALLTERSEIQDAISDKIINLVGTDVESYGLNFGWEPCLYPIGNKLIINVPQEENKTQYQYVMNTITGAWTRFTNWNANCFAVLNDKLFFGGNLGTTPNSAYVAQADVGYSDNGAYITGEVKTAFQYFGAPGQLKRMTMVRPIFNTAGVISAALAIDVDFSDVFPTASPTFSGVSGTAWNTAPWNTFPWGDITSIKKDWQSVTGIGHAMALHMRVVNNASSLQWMSVDYVYEIGGVI